MSESIFSGFLILLITRNLITESNPPEMSESSINDGIDLRDMPAVEHIGPFTIQANTSEKKVAVNITKKESITAVI